MATTVRVNMDEPKRSSTMVYVSFRNKDGPADDRRPKLDRQDYFTLRNKQRISGSDPRLQTCRGKLQSKRSKLNMEIDKELMLRSGAENLFHATNNKKLKEMVALEIQFFNSNLHLLKSQLGDLNSSVEVYQGDNGRKKIPMIPLGLKETKEINFREPFKDFILEHYSEDPSMYEEAITEFMELREAMRTPERDESGVALLFEYFNQLYFIDRRFFPPDRSLGIYFEWYDSLTGTPSCQRTIAFEKACVLFNLGALYTQLGARHDPTTSAGLEAAVNSFLRASGVFRFLHDTFTNAPSKDLSPDVLDMLIQLMLAQARECLHEKAMLNRRDNAEMLLELAQESAFVAKEYSIVHSLISKPSVKDYVPPSWIGMTQIKAEHYKGCAHFHVAEAMLSLQIPLDVSSPGEHNDLGLSHRAREILSFLHQPSASNTTIRITLPVNRKERTLLGLSHGREAVQVHEEAFRLFRMCRDLRKESQNLSRALTLVLDDALNLIEDFKQDDDLITVLDPPPIQPSTKIQVSLSSPDFSQHKVEDIFKRLGPVPVFSARRRWFAPRSVTLVRSERQGFGFSVKGDAPVVIAGVDDKNSVAARAGIQEGDIIVSISGRDVKWMPHDEVVSLIREAGNSLPMCLVTPNDKPQYELSKSKSLKDLSPHSTTSSSSGVSSNASSRCSNYGSMNGSTLSSSHKDKRLSWNPFKRTTLRDKLKAESLTDCNIILR